MERLYLKHTYKQINKRNGSEKMYIVIGLAFGLILANKIVGIHMLCEKCKLEVQEELKIIK